MDMNTNENNNQQKSSLQNIENYKCNFSCNLIEIFTKYVEVISEYLKNCSEMIYMENNEYYKYVIIKGMETVAHVFRILLLYTRNLNLTSYHSQKSFYYYVEFISQIGDNNHSFLQLNSCDASLFVYKKSIYEINQEYRKKFTSNIEENILIENVNSLIYIFNNLIIEMLEVKLLKNKNMILKSNEKNNIINKEERICDIKNINSKISDNRLEDINKESKKMSQMLINLLINIDNKQTIERLEIIKEFMVNNIWRINNIEMKEKHDYIELFLKGLKKNNTSINKIKKNIMNEENINKYEILPALQYINWLMS